MKKSDIILLTIMLATLFAGVIAYFTNSFIIGIIALLIISALIGSLLILVKRKQQVISKDDFLNNLLLLGKENSWAYIRKLHPNLKQDGDTFVENGIMIANSIKYSALGEEEVAAYFRTATKINAKEIIIYTHVVDKKALNLSFRLNVKTKIINFKKFYGLLKANELLPPKEQNILKRKGIKAILNGLAYIPIKYFAISCISCAILSIFVPLKLYYLVFAAINAITGIVVWGLNQKLSR